MLINLCKGKGKKGKGKGKGLNGGKGLCFNCGEAGHFAANCPKPKKEDNDKGNGKGNGKNGKGINSLADIFKSVGSPVPNHDDKKTESSVNYLAKPTCCIKRWSHEIIQSNEVIRNELAYDEDHPDGLNEWVKPRKTMKSMKKLDADKQKTTKVPLSVFMKMNLTEQDEPNKDDEEDVDSANSVVSENRPNESKTKVGHDKKVRKHRVADAHHSRNSVATPSLKACPSGQALRSSDSGRGSEGFGKHQVAHDDSGDDERAKVPQGAFPSGLAPSVHLSTELDPENHERADRGIKCLSKLQLNSIENKDVSSEIEEKIENL